MSFIENSALCASNACPERPRRVSRGEASRKAGCRKSARRFDSSRSSGRSGAVRLTMAVIFGSNRSGRDGIALSTLLHFGVCAMMRSRLVSKTPTDRDFVHSADCPTEHREGVMPDLPPKQKETMAGRANRRDRLAWSEIDRVPQALLLCHQAVWNPMSFLARPCRRFWGEPFTRYLC